MGGRKGAGIVSATEVTVSEVQSGDMDRAPELAQLVLAAHGAVSNGVEVTPECWETMREVAHDVYWTLIEQPRARIREIATLRARAEVAEAELERVVREAEPTLGGRGCGANAAEIVRGKMVALDESLERVKAQRLHIQQLETAIAAAEPSMIALNYGLLNAIAGTKGPEMQTVSEQIKRLKNLAAVLHRARFGVAGRRHVPRARRAGRAGARRGVSRRRLAAQHGAALGRAAGGVTHDAIRRD
jgi:hypothetical protein